MNLVEAVVQAQRAGQMGPIHPRLAERLAAADALGDAWDEPDTGKSPCDFCRRLHPCGCATYEERLAGSEFCMCSCGRCMAP